MTHPEKALLRAWWALCIATGGRVLIRVENNSELCMVDIQCVAYGVELASQHCSLLRDMQGGQYMLTVKRAERQCHELLREVMYLRFSREQIVQGWSE